MVKLVFCSVKIWNSAQNQEKLTMFSFSVYRFSLKDVVDALAEDESNLLDVDGTFISPPDVNMDSDEDSSSKDEGGFVDNLTGRQLLADAEISLSDGQTISNEAELRAAFSPQAPVTHNKWTEEDFLFQQDCIFPVSNYEEYRDFTPVQFFEIFFN